MAASWSPGSDARGRLRARQRLRITGSARLAKTTAFRQFRRAAVGLREDRLSLRLALICAFAASANLAGAASAWRWYANDRFGVSADVPADWREQPPPENDDGRIFVSPDGKAQLIVNGGFVTEETAALALEAHASPRAGERATYVKRGAHAVILSWTSGDNIFYRRTILTCSDKVWNNVELTYPASQKQAFDPLVTHVAQSLRGGEPAGMRCKP
jgi:hypothetical protein